MNRVDEDLLAPPEGMQRIQSRVRDLLLELSRELNDPAVQGSNPKRIVFREEDHGYCCTLVCLPAHDYRELTRREREVMSLVQQGLSNKAIAAELGTSFSTATTHVRNIFRKLRISSRSELLAGAPQDSTSGRGTSSLLL
jgi:DNA-binding NarL/FixJ family response regulator